MIELGNGVGFQKVYDLERFLAGIGVVKLKLLCFTADDDYFGKGVKHALSTAIAAIDAAIENAELALKSAQRKEEKMKAAKKPAVKPVAKKPAIKKTAKPVAKKK